jgi:hypothetical protein
MGLKRMTATVYLYDQPDKAYEVEVMHQDRLRAELKTADMGIDPEKHQQHLAASWSWAAMKREGHYSGKLEAFLYQDCADVSVATETDPETGEAAEVPPTGTGAPPEST